MTWSDPILQARRDCRIETLRDLATLADEGIEITAAALREMADECERATTQVDEVGDEDDSYRQEIREAARSHEA